MPDRRGGRPQALPHALRDCRYHSGRATGHAGRQAVSQGVSAGGAARASRKFIFSIASRQFRGMT
ncbi:protein of unknown function [Burkholderia multivorans]